VGPELKFVVVVVVVADAHWPLLKLFILAAQLQEGFKTFENFSISSSGGN